MSKNVSVPEATGRIPGYFIAMGSEEIESLNGQKHFNQGRAGIFHKKEKLIETVVINPALQGREITVVEINVPEKAIINQKDGKFGIKKGYQIPIIEIQSFMN